MAGLLAAVLGLAVPGPLPAHPDLVVQIEALDSELAEHPNDIDLLIRRGDLHRRHGDLEAAERDFERVRRIDPEFDQLDFYLGRLALESGDARRATALLEDYLQRRPRHAAAWSLLGTSRLAEGQPRPAAADFARAIEHSAAPTPTLYLQQAGALAAAGDGGRREALRAVNRGLERFPQDIALLAFGVDLALEDRDAAAAARYIDAVPAPVRQLPQWQQRLAALETMRRRGPG